MSKKRTDFALYREGLRQLRTVGIIYFVILELGAILNCTSELITQSINFLGRGDRTLTVFQANAVLPAALPVFTAMMVLYLFHFADKRGACDFYHALPCRRSALFLSFYAAVLTWLTAGVLLSFLTSAVGFQCFGVSVHLALSSVPHSLLTAFSFLVYLSAAVLLAMSVTGTMLNNLLAAALIVAAPRLFLTAFTSSVVSGLPILAVDPLSGALSDTYMPGILSDRYNPFYHLLVSVGSSPAGVGPDLFALAAGLALAAAALWFFRSRRSETAGRSAFNRVLQAIFRLTFAMLICLIPCGDIAQSAFFPSAGTGVRIFGFAVPYVIALVSYFLYELVTTRKLRNLPKTIPALAILVLLNLGFIFGGVGIRDRILNDTPAPEEIQSVTFLKKQSSVGDDQNRNNLLVSHYDTRLESAAVNAIVSEELKGSVRELKTYGTYPYGSARYQNSQFYALKIELKHRTLYRNLYFDVQQMQAVNEQFGDPDT